MSVLPPGTLKRARTEAGQRLDLHHEFELTGFYFDTDDEPCTFGRWAELREQLHADPDAPEFRVDSTVLAEGYIWIVTDWLGMNVSIALDGRPRIYETMIFGGMFSEEAFRTPTRALALRAHELLVLLARRDRTMPLLGRKPNCRKFSSSPPRSRMSRHDPIARSRRREARAYRVR